MNSPPLSSINISGRLSVNKPTRRGCVQLWHSLEGFLFGISNNNGLLFLQLLMETRNVISSSSPFSSPLCKIQNVAIWTDGKSKRTDQSQSGKKKRISTGRGFDSLYGWKDTTRGCKQWDHTNLSSYHCGCFHLYWSIGPPLIDGNDGNRLMQQKLRY